MQPLFQSPWFDLIWFDWFCFGFPSVQASGLPLLSYAEVDELLLLLVWNLGAPAFSSTILMYISRPTSADSETFYDSAFSFLVFYILRMRTLTSSGLTCLLIFLASSFRFFRFYFIHFFGFILSISATFFIKCMPESFRMYETKGRKYIPIIIQWSKLTFCPFSSIFFTCVWRPEFLVRL